MKSVCIICSLCIVVCSTRTVFTKNGWVQGELSDNGKFDSFLGIPYAEVDPENPFGATLEIEMFHEVFKATDDSAICPQQNDIDFSIVGTLDCLKINVYVPRETSSNNILPVMVFIHGGDFRRWNPNRKSYGPDFLMNSGVILVTFNYRLGPYGFMSIDRSDIPGNAGLRDQLKALEWVKQNIKAFDGDDNNITLFGEGAGAASVEVHILSKHSKGLFHKAILQSGTTLCDWAMVKPDTRSVFKLADSLGLTTDDVDDALHFLSKSDPQDVIGATLDMGYAELFKPSVEHEFENVKAMITEKPRNLLKQAANSLVEQPFSMPIIIGFNSKEEQRLMRDYLMSPEDYFERENKTFEAKLRQYFNLNAEELEEAEKLVRYFYIGDEGIGPNTVNELLEFNSDFSFVYPILRDTRYYLKANTQVYLYIFDYAGKRNYMKNRFGLTWEVGAVHGDELGYLFHQSYAPLPSLLKEMETIARMTRMWTDFARTGNPTPNVRSKLSSFKWQPSKTEPLLYAMINDECQMIQHPYQERMAFWDNFFDIYGAKAKF